MVAKVRFELRGDQLDEEARQWKSFCNRVPNEEIGRDSVAVKGRVYYRNLHLVKVTSTEEVLCRNAD